MSLFQMGRLDVSPLSLEALVQVGMMAEELFDRHQQGEWGMSMNELLVKMRQRFQKKNRCYQSPRAIGFLRAQNC
ncbi:MAG: hypothetical protein R2911_24260 [Caldilineaceae bacterium]